MNSVKCPACKLTNFASATVCRRCGAAINALGQLSSDIGLPDQQPDVAVDTVLLEIGVKSNQGSKIAPASKSQLMGKLVLTSSRLCFLAGGTSDSTGVKILLRALLGAAGSVAAELLEGVRVQQKSKALDW